jgi:hypothetical protein
VNAQIKEYEDKLGDLIKERNATISKADSEFAEKVADLRQKLVVELEAFTKDCFGHLGFSRETLLSEDLPFLDFA